MRRHKKHRRNQGEVELNLAAMLDMAFQLLTFFILTFKPSPVEGQVLLRMPPPQPVTNVNVGKTAGSDEQNQDLMKGLDTLVIYVYANADGKLRQTATGAPNGEPSAAGGIGALDVRLTSMFKDPNIVFEQVIIQVDSHLHYDELMKVIDVCTKQTLPNGEKLSKLSFVELPM